MKKLLLITATAFLISMSNAQTIVWKSVASLPISYSSGEAVTLNDKIYFVAGGDCNAATSDFYVYNPSTNIWTKLANMPGARANLAVAAVSGKIYAIGGEDFNNTNFEYTPETNTWKTLTPMPTSRQHIDCGVINNKIYVIGGITSFTSITKKNEVYDPATDTWMEKASIPSLRNNPAIVKLDTQIYVIGGAGSETDIWKSIATVECYNTNTDKWISKSNLPNTLFKPGTLVVNNKIYVLGGQNANGNSVTSVLVYDQENDKWKNTTALPKINCFAGYASIGNKIYIIGGSTSAPNWTCYTDVYEGTVTETIPSSVINNQNETYLRIFPNPTTSKFSIKLSKNPSQVNVYNIQGAIVFSKNYQNTTSATIDLTSNSAGIYVVKVIADGVSYEEKIVKE